jgi:hypothetical protein
MNMTCCAAAGCSNPDSFCFISTLFTSLDCRKRSIACTLVGYQLCTTTWLKNSFCCRAHKDLRAALAVLSMAAAMQPQAFSKAHLLSLLRYGFSSRCSDALITRHACTALQRLAENFQTG